MEGQVDRITGRPNHIEDVLVDLHDGQWFTFTDGEHKTYDDLIILDDSKDTPTKKSLTDALSKAQSDFDNVAYIRNRRPAYPSIGDQLDMIYKDNLNSTTTHKDAVEVVKTKWPKDNSGPV